MTIHHYGIVVTNIHKSIQLYIRMGYRLSTDIIFDNIQKNKVAILESDFSPRFELIEAIDKNSTINNFNPGYHHICYVAEPGEDIVNTFKEMKIGKIFTKPIVAPALDNRKVVFACLQNGTFIEFVI